MNTFAAIMASALIVVILLFFDNISSSIRMSFLTLFSESRRREYLSTPFNRRSSVISFIISVPVIAYALDFTGISEVGFGNACLTVASLIAVQIITTVLLGRMSGEYEVYEEMRLLGCCFVIMASVLFLLSLIKVALPESSPQAFRIAFLIVFGLLVLIRLAYLVRRVSAMKFSLCFTFLYICGLKILPVALAVKELMY